MVSSHGITGDTICDISTVASVGMELIPVLAHRAICTIAHNICIDTRSTILFWHVLDSIVGQTLYNISTITPDSESRTNQTLRKQILLLSIVTNAKLIVITAPT